MQKGFLSVLKYSGGFRRDSGIPLRRQDNFIVNPTVDSSETDCTGRSAVAAAAVGGLAARAGCPRPGDASHPVLRDPDIPPQLHPQWDLRGLRRLPLSPLANTLGSIPAGAE